MHETETPRGRPVWIRFVHAVSSHYGSMTKYTTYTDRRIDSRNTPPSYEQSDDGRERADLYVHDDGTAGIRTGYVDEWLRSDLIVEVNP